MSLNYKTQQEAFSPEVAREVKEMGLSKLLSLGGQEMLHMHNFYLPVYDVPVITLPSEKALHEIYSDLVKLPGNSIRVGGVLSSPSINAVIKRPIHPIYHLLSEKITGDHNFDASLNNSAIDELNHLKEHIALGLPVAEHMLLRTGIRYNLLMSKGKPLKHVSDPEENGRLLREFHQSANNKGFMFTPNAKNPNAGLYQFGHNGDSRLLASGYSSFKKLK